MVYIGYGYYTFSNNEKLILSVKNVCVLYKISYRIHDEKGRIKWSGYLMALEQKSLV